MASDKSVRYRLSALMVFCLIFAAALLGRAALIQLARQPRLEAMARRQFQSHVLLRPRRGPILDRNGEPLAINVEKQSLAANPSKIHNKRTMARLLSRATDLPMARLLTKLGEKREFTWIKRHLTEAELEKFRKLRVIEADGDLAEGLWLVKESKRVYPLNEVASHVLGDVNLDSEGLEGTELLFNDRLRGRVVSFNAVKDALGRPTFIDAAAVKDVKDGEPVSLTLDASLQYASEQVLRAAVSRHNARGGSVIVMNAVNGEILAMAGQPSFNPNERGAPPERRRNRSITDGYEPGSTLKAVLLAGALSNGYKLSTEVWGEHGKFKIQGRTISEAEAHEKFEWLTLKQMIQYSSNIGAAKLALKLGADRYLATLKTFGIGARSGLGFPGEIGGRLPPRKSWQPLTVANIGFGQGLLATRIQMTRAYATFLNGGWLVQPTLLKAPAESAKVEPPRRIISEKVAQDVMEALSSVTQEGRSGFKANVPGYKVAGKTGTAQMVDPATGAYSHSKYISSFIGFATNVEPRLVIFTSIDEPKGIYYAAETAAPLFRDVLSAVMNRFSVPTTEATPRTLASRIDRIRLSQANPAPASVITADDLPTFQWDGMSPTGGQTWKMPSLKGLSPREAMRSFQGRKFQVEIHGIGIVRAQSPEEGRVLADGDTIRLTLGEP